MRVGLNATCLTDRPSGARQRFVGIYSALARLRPDVEFIVYEPRDCRIAASLGSLPNVVARPTPISSGGGVSRLVSGLGYWSRQLRTDRLDLFECFNMPMIEAPDCPTLLTIHDARHVHDEVSWFRRFVNRLIWHRALSRTDHVITVSDTMRDEILVFHPGVPITTIYNGIDPAPFAEAARTATPGDYLLAVGHLEPRKNYERLVAAMALLAGQGRPLDLVIVGRDGGSRKAVIAAIAAAGLTERVSIRSDVDDATLVRLYAGARLVVFPSIYEGFGIPLLEAMAARRPLVLSDIPVFRELAEDRAVYFDPINPACIAETIAARLDDPAAVEDVYAAQGRLSDFSFFNLAAKISTLYSTLV